MRVADVESCDPDPALQKGVTISLIGRDQARLKELEQEVSTSSLSFFCFVPSGQLILFCLLLVSAGCQGVQRNAR